MRKLVCLALLFLLSTVAPALPQGFGQITGIVSDTTGGVLPGASVTVTNTQTAVIVSQQTNTAGVYVVPNLLPGVYDVKVEMDGFRSAARNSLELQIQQAIRLDFKLGSARSPRRSRRWAPLRSSTPKT